MNGDTVPEPDETFTVNLNNGTNVTLGADTQSQGTIVNDDSGVTASISDMTVTEGNSGTVNATFTIALSAAAPTASTITWRTADGSATAGSDYVAVPNTVLNIAQNATSAQVTVVVNGDSVPEPNETFFVDLVSSTGSVSISADNRGTGTITNDDSSATASINDVTVTEGASPNTVNATFTVTISPAAPAPATITWRTANGTASSPADYNGVGNTILNIAQGATTAQITVTVNGDGLPEPSENFFVDLVGSTGPVTIGADNRGTGTITDDDSTPSASINDVTVTEGNVPSTVNATFTVTLSSAAPAPVTITYRTADGTAASPADYTGVPNTVLNIAQGANSGQITIVVKGDGLPEPSENFFVDLVGFTGPVTISDSRGTGTITDDDSTPSASINDVTVTEGNSPSTVNATFTVTLSGPAPAPVQIRYSTVNGSAGAPNDFNAASNATLNIAQGATSGQFSIVVNGDNVPEGAGNPLAENFFVDLVGFTGPVTISADSRGTGTIVDDDSTPSASISDVTVGEGNAPNTVNATFTVTLSGPAQAPVTITYRTADNSASSPADYTGVPNTVLNIAQGASSGQITIVVKGDAVPEGAENFFVDLVGFTGPVTISADSRGIGTITDDDAPPSASISDASVTEGTGGTVNATFTVSLSFAAPAPVQIRYTTVDNSAVAPGDYAAVSNAVLNIAPGESGGQFSIVVQGDALPEGNETFFVDINASGATVARSRGTGTIVNDDTAPVPTIAPASVAEGNSGTKQLVFTVTMPPRGQAVTFDYTTIEGTATASGASPDYQVAGGLEDIRAVGQPVDGHDRGHDQRRRPRRERRGRSRSR